MTDLITDAMVEAAAIALRNQTRERVGLSPLDRLPWSPTPGEARADARAALEAAAPLIAAKALRDAADEVRTHSYKPGDVTGVPTSEQVSWLVGTSDAHRMVDRLLKGRAERFEHDARCPHRKCPGAVGVCCCPAAES